MGAEYFIKGAVIGFSIALPVGPIGLLCIQRSLANGFKSGFMTGLGAATADSAYGIIAGFGITFISVFLLEYKVLFQAAGLLFLFFLGSSTFFEQSDGQFGQSRTDRSLVLDYIATFGLTITNPATILSFIAVFAGAGLASTASNYLASILLVMGVFIGSAAWWLILSTTVSLSRHRLNRKTLKFSNRLAGFILILFALIISIDLLHQL